MRREFIRELRGPARYVASVPKGSVWCPSPAPTRPRYTAVGRCRLHVTARRKKLLHLFFSVRAKAVRCGEDGGRRARLRLLITGGSFGESLLLLFPVVLSVVKLANVLVLAVYRTMAYSQSRLVIFERMERPLAAALVGCGKGRKESLMLRSRMNGQRAAR